jgi:hypothetical protein
MIELGKKSEIFGVDLLKSTKVSGVMGGRPEKMPALPEGHSLICGYVQAVVPGSKVRRLSWNDSRY